MKYNNKKTIVCGIKFDSKKEANRYLELNQLEKDGKIASLETQVKFDININSQHVCYYIADFVYYRIVKGELVKVVEDVKSAVTSKLPVYRLKKKLMKAVLNINISEA